MFIKEFTSIAEHNLEFLPVSDRPITDEEKEIIKITRCLKCTGLYVPRNRCTFAIILEKDVPQLIWWHSWRTCFN